MCIVVSLCLQLILICFRSLNCRMRICIDIFKWIESTELSWQNETFVCVGHLYLSALQIWMKFVFVRGRPIESFHFCMQILDAFHPHMTHTQTHALHICWERALRYLNGIFWNLPKVEARECIPLHNRQMHSMHDKTKSWIEMFRDSNEIAFQLLSYSDTSTSSNKIICGRFACVCARTNSVRRNRFKFCVHIVCRHHSVYRIIAEVLQSIYCRCIRNRSLCLTQSIKWFAIVESNEWRKKKTQTARQHQDD